jgi:predicted ATPase/class 3 adenylate cyclase
MNTEPSTPPDSRKPSADPGAAGDLLSQLSRYVPSLVIRQLADAQQSPPGPRAEPLAQHGLAAVLFADITGFTSLAEGLTRQGPAGTETLSQMLNEYFGLLTALINVHGGDVLKFAGDALVAVWMAADQAALAATALRAANCALVIQERLHRYRFGSQALTMRIGLGAGPISAVHLGGLYGRTEFTLLGETMAQVARAEGYAQPGQIVLTAAICQLAAEQIECVPTADDYQRLTRLRAAPPPEPLDPAILPPAAIDTLRSYIPEVVLARIAANQTGYLSELRLVTVLFIQLPEPAAERIGAELAQLQALVVGLQEILEHFEGSLNKLSIDDKGNAIVAAFGLPPYAHEDDAARAVLAALEMQRLIAHSQSPSRSPAIGIATGRVFCGIVGGALRREYTLIGQSVNLAARLMQASQADSAAAILCDEATYQAASERVHFARLPDLAVKGRAGTLAVYQPIAAQQTLRKARSAAARQLVGRAAEQAALDRALKDVAAGQGRVCIIEGEAGLGKSRLVEAVQQRAAAMGLATRSGAADAVEQSTPYHVWRPVFQELLGLEALPTAAARQERVERALGAERAGAAPLLNSLLLLDLPDNELTRPMTDQLRAENTRSMLLALLAAAAAQPLVVILEDTHWMDSASWALALEVGRRIPAILLIIASRPMGELAPAVVGELAALPGSIQLRLGPLPADDIQALVCQRLGVATIPAEVEALIRRKAEGNPFFSEELAYALRDSGIVQIADGECRLAPTINLDHIALPDTVQGVVASRIDKLPPAQQLALKVASVVGRVFALRVLGAVYPVEVDKPHLAAYLDMLQRLDITPRDLSALELQYSFKHAITHEVAYSFLLFAQRRELHRAIAEWYEQSAGDLTPFYPLLAHHWSRAAEGAQDDEQARAKAAGYLSRAGEQALRASAFGEARSFFEQALGFMPGESISLERAILLNTLGLTYLQLSNYPAAQERLTASLELARMLDDRQAIVNALWGLGWVGWQMGAYREAQLHLEEGLELATALQDLTGVAQILKHLGVVAYYRGKNAQAHFYFERSLQLARDLGEPVLIGSLLNNIGNTARMDGDYAQARAYYAEGLAFCRKHHVHWVMAMLLGNLALVAHTTGALDEAQSYHRESLRLHTQNGNKWGIAIVKCEMGLLADEMGDVPAAQRSFIEGLHIALEINALPKALSSLAGLARLYARLGRDQEAARLTGFIAGHPTTDSEARRILAMAEADLQTRLSPDEYAALREQGAAQSIDEVVAGIETSSE